MNVMGKYVYWFHSRANLRNPKWNKEREIERERDGITDYQVLGRGKGWSGLEERSS